MRTTISKAIMGLACLSMLASCAKTVTADEAKKIASNWKVDEAAQTYKKGTVKSKDSKGNESTNNYDLTNDIGKGAVKLLIVASAAAVSTAASIDGVNFKADGTALEFTYKDEDGTTEYKTNEFGLPVFTKTTASDGSWSQATYTWSK